MGRLRGGASTEDEAEHLTLAQLNKLIAHAQWRFYDAGLNSGMQKDAFDRLVWLERQREKLHGVPAPNRKRPRRG
jgi:hypothetical protein